MNTLKKIIAVLLVLILVYPGKIVISAAADGDLTAPVDLKATAYKNYISLSWESKEDSYSYYYTVIEKRIDQGDFYPIITLNKGKYTYNDYGVSNGHVYTYRAYTYYMNKRSPYTSEVEVIMYYPINLTVTQTYSNQVDLEWEYPPLYGVKIPDNKIQIERRLRGSNEWSLMATLPITETTWRDISVFPDTFYYYRIRAQFTNGNESYNIPSDNGISARTTFPLATALTGYAISDTAIRLEWDTSGAYGASYVLEKKNIAGDFSPILYTNKLSSFVEYGLTKGKTYTYRMHMISPNGAVSEPTEEIEIITETVPAPWELSASAIDSDGGIALTWTYPFEVETGFEVWRKGIGTWELITLLPRNSDSFVDRNVVDGQTYQYKVRAIRGETAYSSFTLAEPVSYYYPPQPGNLVHFISDKVLHLYSSNEVPEGTTYTLEYRLDSLSEWKDYKTVAKGTLLALINYSTINQYHFRLRADRSGLSTYSEELHFYGTVPEKPRNFKAALSGSDRVILTWEDMSSIEDGYYIYRTDNNGTRRLLAYVDKDSERYVDESPVPGSTSRYEITAFNTAGETAPVVVNVTIPNIAQFKDIASHKWAHDGIYILYGRGAVQWNNGYFRPDATITKGEAVRWILRSFNIGYQKKGLFTINDLPASHAYYQDLSTAVTMGIIHPDRLDRIYPDKVMTRRDIILLLNDTLNYLGISIFPSSHEILDSFADRGQVTSSESHIIASFINTGIISGKQGKRLALQDAATRAECAAIIYRTLKYYGIN